MWHSQDRTHVARLPELTRLKILKNLKHIHVELDYEYCQRKCSDFHKKFWVCIISAEKVEW